MTVGTKLTASLGIVIVVVMAAHEYAMVRHMKTVAAGEMRRELRVLTRTMQLALEGAIRRGQLGDTQEMVDGIGDYRKVALVAMFDSSGRLAAVTRDKEWLVKATIPKEVLQRALGSGDAVDGYTRAAKDYYYYVGPLHGPAGRLVGAFAVVQDRSWIWEKVVRRTRSTASETVFLIALGGGLVWVLSWRHVSRPIAELARMVKDFGEGKFRPAKTVKGGDEIGVLGQEFNQMAARLTEARQRLVDEHARALRLERELHRSERLASIGKIASGLAHDIATPISVIKGRAELLLARASDEGLRNNLRSVIAQIDRIERTVRSLLSAAPREGTMRPTDVNAVVRSVAELISDEAKAKGVRVTCELEPKLEALVLDPDQLQQVVLNLAMNALQAADEGGAATLSTGWSENCRDKVEVRVEDNGRGIPRRYMESIFEPFFTTKGRKGGTGLGLAISREIVEGFGGKIVAESKGEGCGARFTVKLPVSDNR